MRRTLLLLFALTLLSGCGGADSSLFATAVRNTENAGGAELVFQATFTPPGGGRPVVMTGSGVEDLAEQRARMEMQIPGAGSMEMIADKLVMYIHFDLFTQQLGKEWMKFDLEQTYESLGIDMGALGQVGQGTSEQLRMLGEVSDGITNEGREQVRGVDTTHYTSGSTTTSGSAAWSGGRPWPRARSRR